MEITWYGQACFRIREAGVTIIADPYEQTSEYALPRVRADVVTVSGDPSRIGRPKGVRGEPLILQTPGEYEIGGVFITGVSTWIANDQGMCQNVVFLYEFDGLTVCHLGRLNSVSDQSFIESLDGVHILLVPIAGETTIVADHAAEVVRMIEPNIVVPMHLDRVALEHDPVCLSRFHLAMGAELSVPQEMLKIGSGHLPEGPQIILLECKQ